MVEKVIEIMRVPDSIARGLLIKFQWDVESLLRENYSNENLVYRLFNYNPDMQMEITVS
jgi:hypothetical protein